MELNTESKMQSGSTFEIMEMPHLKKGQIKMSWSLKRPNDNHVKSFHSTFNTLYLNPAFTDRPSF